MYKGFSTTSFFCKLLLALEDIAYMYSQAREKQMPFRLETAFSSLNVLLSTAGMDWISV